MFLICSVLFCAFNPLATKGVGLSAHWKHNVQSASIWLWLDDWSACKRSTTNNTGLLWLAVRLFVCTILDNGRLLSAFCWTPCARSIIGYHNVKRLQTSVSQGCMFCLASRRFWNVKFACWNCWGGLEWKKQKQTSKGVSDSARLAYFHFTVMKILQILPLSFPRFYYTSVACGVSWRNTSLRPVNGRHVMGPRPGGLLLLLRLNCDNLNPEQRSLSKHVCSTCCLSSVST